MLSLAVQPFEIGVAEAAEAAAASGGWDTSDLSRDWGAEADGLRVYSCPSCGAELICDQSTAATACPYCGNPAIVPGQFSGALRPDYILPFRLSKDDAVQALRAHYKGKPFLPRSFTSANHIEQIQGVYVPFWLFDGGAEGAGSYRASNTNVYETGDYEITETRHYHVVRAGSLAFEKIPVDASSKMPDDHMDSIEPFDYAQLRPFSTAYLPGYLADKYDVTIDDSRDRADTRCRETLAQALRDTVTGYGACVTEREVTAWPVCWACSRVLRRVGRRGASTRLSRLRPGRVSGLDFIFADSLRYATIEPVNAYSDTSVIAIAVVSTAINASHGSAPRV